MTQVERVTPASALESALRHGFETGRFDALAEWYSEEAVLESWVTGSCEQVRGGPAIARHLGLGWRGPAPLSHWRVVASSGGCELDVQRPLAAGDGAEAAQHHVVHLGDDGRVSLHLVYPASPRAATPVAPDVLAEAVPDIASVRVLHEGSSGATVYRARLRDGSTVVVKHAVPTADWLMRATRDRGREALLWEAGVFDRLPPQVECPIVSARRAGDGWLIVMRDVEPALRSLARAPSAEVGRVLDAVDALHGVPLPDDPSLLCSCVDRLRIFSPARPLVEWRGVDTIPKTLTRMWQAFADLPAGDVVEAVLACVDDPEPLLERLARHPQRLLHGDVRLPNLGGTERSVVLIDWALACLGPAELDVVWLLGDATFWCDAEPAELLERWSRSARVPLDAEALDLAFVFQAAIGEVAYLAHELAQRPAGSPLRPSPERVDWWLDRVRLAFDRLGLG